MARIILTGGKGLLGSHLLPLLAARGDEVVSLERPAFDLSRPIDSARLPESADAVIYLAQSPRFREFPDGARDMFAVNVARVAELLDYAAGAGVRTFVLASTGGVYAPSEEPLREGSALASPMGYYPASKRSAELLARPYETIMNVVTLRYFFIYGPGQQKHMLVPRLVDSVSSGQDINLQGPVGLRLSPVHVLDAARATVAAADLDRSAVVNVAGPEAVSLRAMAEAIGHSTGSKAIFHVNERPGPIDYVADISRMSDLLGAPTIRFGEGIQGMIGQ